MARLRGDSPEGLVAPNLSSLRLRRLATQSSRPRRSICMRRKVA